MSEWLVGVRHLLSNSERWHDAALQQVFKVACGKDARGVAKRDMGYSQFELNIRAASGQSQLSFQRRIESMNQTQPTWVPATCAPYRFERDPLAYNIM